MRPAEIGSLITGLLVIIGIALAVGQYPRLERFARAQAAQALRGWQPHPFFVKPLPPHQVRHKGGHH